MKQAFSTAFRNLARQRRRTVLLASAIAFGVLVTTLISSFATGAVAQMYDNFAELFSGHLYLIGKEKAPNGKVLAVIRDGDAIESAVKRAGLELRHLSRRAGVDASLIFEGNTAYQDINGVDWSKESHLVPRIGVVRGSMEAFLADPAGLIISEPVAKRLKVEVGDTVVVRCDTLAGQKNVGEMTLRAIIADAGLLGSVSSYGHIAYCSELLGLKPNEFVSLHLYLDDPAMLDRATDALMKALPAAGLSVFERKPPEAGRQQQFVDMARQADESWSGVKYQLLSMKDFMSQVDAMAQIMIGIGNLVYFLILVIIGIGLANTFRMIMFERMREIGTIRALGGQRNDVFVLFLAEAVWISLLGAAAGLTLALAGMGVFSLINFGTASPMSFLMNDGHLAFVPSVPAILGTVWNAAGITALAVLFSAQKASRLEPAKALAARS